MIQRIQSVYLLLVTILLVVAMCQPLGRFVAADGVTAYDFIALATIFLYRNRMLQIRMTIFGSLLLVGYYIASVVFIFVLKGEMEAGFQLGWALCLPAVCIILNYLAFRGIYKDDVMVKAADRLRSSHR